MAILLPPLSKPDLVRLTGLSATPLAMVIPVLLTTVSPVVNEPLAPKLTFSANFMVKVLLPSATTPILFSVNMPVDPPLILTVEPRWRSKLVPVSPAKVNGLITAVFNALSAAETVVYLPCLPSLSASGVPFTKA
ncbi:hypothetical protein [Mannheimia haemolytica]|uniref:hypothetical protein n=1 Tax=Mannheimia haemolytica TaxID=75985 RepID=UPI002EC4180C|nr:hypothetical protein [Mannheimia haemolytica]